MTREEAINIVRNIYQTDTEKEALQALIPELKESEDERIRKVIYKLMLVMRKEIFTSQDEIVTKEKVLAYLEKQKEQKPNIELIQKSWYMEGYHDRKFNNEPKWIIKTGEGGPRYEENPKYGQVIEEEQKPAEWDTHDKAIVNCIVCCLDGQFVPDAARKQSLEWFNKHRRDFLNCSSWKPSEVCYGEKGDPDPAGVWKPTEEQMKVLWDAYKGGKEQEPLRELIEQLKKLM